MVPEWYDLSCSIIDEIFFATITWGINIIKTRCVFVSNLPPGNLSCTLTQSHPVYKATLDNATLVANPQPHLMATLWKLHPLKAILYRYQNMEYI